MLLGALIAVISCSPTKSPSSSDTQGGAGTNTGDVDTDTDTDTDADSDSGLVPPITAEPGTALYHAQQCAQQLGPIPTFSCSDALVIPVTVDGVEVFDNGLVCDRPAAFGGGCNVGQRVGRKQGLHHDGRPRPEVTYVTFCRDGGLLVIGYNSENGATCYFSVRDSTDSFGSAPGSEDPGYESAWQTPEVVAADGCTGCHQADPFVHSPWIDQVANPENPDEPLVPLSATVTSPYVVIADGFTQPPVADLPGNTCATSCHRAQCVPGHLNLELDKLPMPAPFDSVEYTSEGEADRQAVAEWCERVGLQ